MNKNLPEWLISSFRVALLGEIYSHIRAIAVRYEDNILLIRYYLDRAPTDFDYESIEIVATNLDTTLSGNEHIERIDIECVLFDGSLSKIDSLTGLIYARREYDLELSCPSVRNE